MPTCVFMYSNIAGLKSLQKPVTKAQTSAVRGKTGSGYTEGYIS